ncbi:hypothetical protein MZTS_24135 [Methylorubrum zatmanii]|nr:hypothetical protein [Methylorubrum zatmanii]
MEKWRDPDEHKVSLGQVWDLGGERLTVLGIFTMNGVRTALCKRASKVVMRMPAGALARSAALIAQAEQGASHVE